MAALEVIPSEAEDALYDVLSSLPRHRRSVVAIAGPPGAGKTALTDQLTIRLNQAAPDRAATLPMDGFLLDNVLLSSMGRLERKGAADTFDVGGLYNMVRRLRANAEREIAVPTYDWRLELARSSARLIRQSTDIVLVEGSYLLLQDPPWAPLIGQFDQTVMLQLGSRGLRRRLEAVWAQQGLSPKAAAKQIEEYDLPNAILVLENSSTADHIISTDTAMQEASRENF